MRITGTEETRKGTVVLVKCECGLEIRHPSNRWTVRCNCGRSASISELRKKARENEAKAEASTETPAEAPRTDSGACQGS